MSLNLTTRIAIRRPTLIRVWRLDYTQTAGARLTSTWLPTVAPSSTTLTEGAPRP